MLDWACISLSRVSFLYFPAADFPECSPVVLAYASDQASANAAADRLLRFFEENESAFAGKAWSPEEGVREAYASAYRAVIEDTDLLVGDIVAALGEHRDETLIILTSDHGELLGEHNRVGHGTWLYEGLTNVPLIIDRGEAPTAPPGVRASSVD